MILILKIFCVFVLLFALTEAEARPTECQMWEGVASDAMAQKSLSVNCSANGLCEGFSCSGSLLFEISLLSGREPFGFALKFIPCSYPLVLRILVNSSDLQFMKLLRVHGRNDESIDLLTQDDEGKEQLYGRLNLAWNAILKPVKYFVALEINFTRIFMSGEFPPIPLVPLQNYPIPNCPYGRSSDAPEVVGCHGMNCDTRFQNPLLNKPANNIDNSLILKVSVGVGALLVTLCAFVGFFLMRRQRRSRELQKLRVDNDLKGESEDEDFEEDESVPSARDPPDDRHNLLKI